MLNFFAELALGVIFSGSINAVLKSSVHSLGAFVKIVLSSLQRYCVLFA